MLLLEYIYLDHETTSNQSIHLHAVASGTELHISLLKMIASIAANSLFLQEDIVVTNPELCKRKKLLAAPEA